MWWIVASCLERDGVDGRLATRGLEEFGSLLGRLARYEHTEVAARARIDDSRCRLLLLWLWLDHWFGLRCERRLCVHNGRCRGGWCRTWIGGRERGGHWRWRRRRRRWWRWRWRWRTVVGDGGRCRRGHAHSRELLRRRRWREGRAVAVASRSICACCCCCWRRRRRWRQRHYATGDLTQPVGACQLVVNRLTRLRLFAVLLLLLLLLLLLVSVDASQASTVSVYATTTTSAVICNHSTTTATQPQPAAATVQSACVSAAAKQRRSIWLSASNSDSLYQKLKRFEQIVADCAVASVRLPQLFEQIVL